MRDSDGKNASEVPFVTEDEISGENGDEGWTPYISGYRRFAKNLVDETLQALEVFDKKTAPLGYFFTTKYTKCL